MEEIKVNEYVRTNWGHIRKLKRIELDKNDKGLKWYVFDHKEFEKEIKLMKSVNLEDNYIPKSKVREKIEENKWASEGYDSDTADYGQSRAIGAYIALIKLLQEGDDK